MNVLQQLLVLAALAGSTGHEIINGKKAAEGTLEYMASVQINGTHKCGGFLIAPDFVLTAAHCNLSGDMTVVLGKHCIKGNVKRSKVLRRIVYDPFTKSITGNDIMLLQLSKKVKVGKGVEIIDLPERDDPVKSSSKCSVSGWGFTQNNRKPTADLQVAKVKIIDTEECKKVWKQVTPSVTLPSKVICAGGYDTNKGACQGDSGGPLVCDHVAVGIVSFNLRQNCDYPNVPNVHTQISKFVPWIKKHVKYLS